MQEIISEVRPNLDTIRLIFPAMSEQELLHLNNQLCGYTSQRWIKKFHTGVNLKTGEQIYRKNGCLDVNLHGPTAQMLEVIKGWIGEKRAMLLGIDVAMDFFGESVPEIWAYLKRHQVQKSLRKMTWDERTQKWKGGIRVVGEKRLKVIPGTIYHQRKYAGRGLVMYQRRSKLNGLQCVHAEVRIRSSKSLKREGVSPDNLPGLCDPVRLTNIFYHVAKMIDWNLQKDLEKIGRGVAAYQLKMFGKSIDSTHFRQLGRLATTAIMTRLGENEVTGTVIMELCKTFELRVDKLVRPLIPHISTPTQPQKYEHER